MKIIEALKQIKDLKRKAEDLRDKVQKNCALANFETPLYPDQKRQVQEWIQAHHDVLKEALRLRTAVQRTNLEVEVAIEVGGKSVTKSIAEWIHRRRDLAAEELRMWQGLTDRGIREGIGKGPAGDALEIKVVRFYDPTVRDNMIAQFSDEPSIIDAKLEIVNAITDIIE